VKNVTVPSTGWWHNYLYIEDLSSLKFDTPGLHVVTVHIESIAPPVGFKEWGNLVWIGRWGGGREGGREGDYNLCAFFFF